MKILYIILTFCIGLLTGYLIFDHDTFSKAPKNTNIEAGTLKSIQINNEKVLAEATLKKQNNLLSGQLLLANKEISAGKTALNIERQNIKRLQSKLAEDTVNKKDSAIIEQVDAHLDTLQEITDSIIGDYEDKVKITESIVAVRDSQLVICNSSYQQMQNLVNEQVARERQLNVDLNTALKQQRRTRLQNRFLAMGILFVSGLTTTLLIKAKH